MTNSGFLQLMYSLEFNNFLSRLVKACSRYKNLVFGVTTMIVASKIKLSIGAVPITFQTMGVGFIGLFCNTNDSYKIMSTYILMAALGIPVLCGNTSGLVTLMGPTGGYILGFLPAAVFISYFKDIFIYCLICK